MVSFEEHFRLERKILNLPEDNPWPIFKRPIEKDYVFIENMEYLNGSAIIINCGDCEGPSYLGNNFCLLCVKEVLRELSNNGKPRPQFIILSRITPSDVIEDRET